MRAELDEESLSWLIASTKNLEESLGEGKVIYGKQKQSLSTLLILIFFPLEASTQVLVVVPIRAMRMCISSSRL